MKRKDQSVVCKHMTFISFIILLTLSIKFIDAQEEQDKRLNIIGDDLKRAGFLPARGRRFWSIFDWEDSGEKRMSRFLPMRGRKAGFLPMRGKKFSDLESENDYNDDPISYGTGSTDINNEFIGKRAAFMPSRGKKAFHTLNDKKTAKELLGFDDNSSKFRNNLILDKKSNNFFGMRG